MSLDPRALLAFLAGTHSLATQECWVAGVSFPEHRPPLQSLLLP